MTSIDPALFRRSVEAEKISLERMGYNAERTDARKMSYVRGYIWRNYRIRIKPPLDYIIWCMVADAIRAHYGSKVKRSELLDLSLLRLC